MNLIHKLYKLDILIYSYSFKQKNLKIHYVPIHYLFEFSEQNFYKLIVINYHKL